MLLANIGRTPAWDWIVCTTDVEVTRWTQAPYRVRPLTMRRATLAT
jgi:hypothetical protein